MRAAEIHTRLAGRWHEVLVRLGIDETFLKNKHGPCPACGGKDRFRFDNKRGRGDFFCNGCGAGDGFQLAMRVQGWDFSETRRRVLEAAGLCGAELTLPPARTPRAEVAQASPTRRIWKLLQESCQVEACEQAVQYLQSRSLWLLAANHGLRAHPGAEYWHEHRRIGVFPALVAPMRDIAGDWVTVHLTYLSNGRKLTSYEPRKLLSPLTGHIGCAVRLAPLSDEVLGIGEGLETCLAAAQLHAIPTWAALNAALLSRFQPPSQIRRLVIFGDRDVAGLQAATELMQRLQGRVTLEIRTPKPPAKDWADELRKIAERGGTPSP